MSQPGWQRLLSHSYRLGWRWLGREAGHGFRGARVGLCRLLVPLDPWRYYKLGKVAEQEFAGRCLDVSSPKLLPSLLQRERRGDWVAVDLFSAEIERWRRVDPQLHLEVQDARRLPYADASFDHCISVSVLEHIAGDGDTEAMAEMRRVLRPGGILHLTTNVSSEPREIYHDRAQWGEASTRVGERVFFERHYTPADLERRLLPLRWEILEREYAQQIDPEVERRFHAWSPLAYLWGGLLRLRCPQNFAVAAGPALLRPEPHGVVYLKLRKPAA